MFISILIIIVSGLLALIVLAQNPKGGGLAAGFTGAQQIGGVQRTADFLEKSTWTLAAALMVLCLASSVNRSSAKTDELDTPITVPDQNQNPSTALPADSGTKAVQVTTPPAEKK